MRSPYCGGNLVIFHEFAAVFIRANTVVRFEAEDNRTRDQSWRPTSKAARLSLVRNEASGTERSKPRPLWCDPIGGQKRAPLAAGASAAERACLCAWWPQSCSAVATLRSALQRWWVQRKQLAAVAAEWLGARCEVGEEAIHSTRDTLVEPSCAACVREPGSRAVWPSWQSAADMRVAGGREGGEMLAAEDADYERTLQGGDRHPGPRFSASAHVETTTTTTKTPTTRKRRRRQRV